MKEESTAEAEVEITVEVEGGTTQEVGLREIEKGIGAVQGIGGGPGTRAGGGAVGNIPEVRETEDIGMSTETKEDIMSLLGGKIITRGRIRKYTRKRVQGVVLGGASRRGGRCCRIEDGRNCWRGRKKESSN
mmetsp:Transcript_45459/g.33237  ORF Transcript_45459/g.33237 Transcript_45459/m.33237 type:complete len:132 (+) Transcript_45459:548-943(+)